LFHYAGKRFPTVMVYAEQSMYPQDLQLVSHALASGATAEISGKGVRVTSERPVVFRMKANGKVSVDGKQWPCNAADGVLLPKGTHQVALSVGSGSQKPRLIRLNGDLLDARYIGEQAIEFSYAAGARAIALFDRPIRSLRLDDGSSVGSGLDWALLPAGLHHIRVFF
jgi:hypothetical protein